MTFVREAADPAIVSYVLTAELGEVAKDAYQTTIRGVTVTHVDLVDGGSIRHYNELGETYYYDAKGRLTCVVEY